MWIDLMHADHCFLREPSTGILKKYVHTRARTTAVRTKEATEWNGMEQGNTVLEVTNNSLEMWRSRGEGVKRNVCQKEGRREGGERKIITILREQDEVVRPPLWLEVCDTHDHDGCESEPSIVHSSTASMPRWHRRTARISHCTYSPGIHHTSGCPTRTV